MGQEVGRIIPLSGPRKFIIDLLDCARQVPSIPVGRVFSIGPVLEARELVKPKPSIAVLFLKAFGLVAEAHPELRRSLLTFPYLRLYEHPYSIASLAIERTYQGERGIFVGLFRAPERQSISVLQQELNEFRTIPVESLGYYRQILRISSYPRAVRRFLWWSTLNFSGEKRCKRLGTFGVSSYGSLGAESYHPISPLSITMTYGPIDIHGRVTVKLVYDHRINDGAEIARRLNDLEHALLGPIQSELRGLTNPGTVNAA